MPSTPVLCVIMVLAAVAACAWAATNDTLFDELDYSEAVVHFYGSPEFPRRERFLRGWYMPADLSFNWTHELPEWGKIVLIDHPPIVRDEALFYNCSGGSTVIAQRDAVFPDRARFLRVNASAPTMRALVSGLVSARS